MGWLEPVEDTSGRTGMTTGSTWMTTGRRPKVAGRSYLESRGSDGHGVTAMVSFSTVVPGTPVAVMVVVTSPFPVDSPRTTNE